MNRLTFRARELFSRGMGMLLISLSLVAGAEETNRWTWQEGGIVRGPLDQKRLALEFTGDSFGEGGTVILDALAQHKAKGSFFFTGKFLRNPDFKPILERIIKEGHYLGSHSDTHPLYCPWGTPKTTLVTREFFTSDVEKSLEEIARLGRKRSEARFWIPPYEWYNPEISSWSKDLGLTLINYSPGTRSNADYIEDSAKNFISSQAILDSIFKKEKEDPHGLNGFLLLMHTGVGPKRTDKFFNRLDELVGRLQKEGYQFVRVDELLVDKAGK